MCPRPGPPLQVWGSPGVLHLPAPGSGRRTQPLGCHLQPCPVSFSGVTRESRVTKGPGQTSRQPPEVSPGEGERQGVSPASWLPSRAPAQAVAVEPISGLSSASALPPLPLSSACLTAHREAQGLGCPLRGVEVAPGYVQSSGTRLRGDERSCFWGWRCLGLAGCPLGGAWLGAQPGQYFPGLLVQCLLTVSSWRVRGGRPFERPLTYFCKSTDGWWEGSFPLNSGNALGQLGSSR